MTSEAKAVSGQEGPRGHILPLSVYLGVYGALLFFTALTVTVSMANLGQIALYVAMAVAVIKASLVVGYFMHHAWIFVPESPCDPSR